MGSSRFRSWGVRQGRFSLVPCAVPLTPRRRRKRRGGTERNCPRNPTPFTSWGILRYSTPLNSDPEWDDPHPPESVSQKTPPNPLSSPPTPVTISQGRPSTRTKRWSHFLETVSVGGRSVGHLCLSTGISGHGKDCVKKEPLQLQPPPDTCPEGSEGHTDEGRDGRRATGVPGVGCPFVQPRWGRRGGVGRPDIYGGNPGVLRSLGLRGDWVSSDTGRVGPLLRSGNVESRRSQ